MTLINREDAIVELRLLIPYKKYHKGEWVHLLEKREVFKALNALPSAEAEWIPCSERLPEENEYVGNVCKYYLIQDEYGDMHVAHLSGRGWGTIESVKALGCDVVAWMPLPEPYREDGEV